MSWWRCDTALVRSRLRVTGKGRAARISVRSGRNLTIRASGCADGAGVVVVLALTGGWLTGRTWTVALGSAADSGTDSGCGSASSGSTGAASMEGAAGAAASLI